MARGSLATVLSLVTSALAVRLRSNGTWSGWKSTEYLFVFGDSYTQTGFNITGTQPSPSNPMGNPPYPGWTSSNGPNWVDFLTFTYNESLIQTYNLAYGGATVDSALVAPYKPTVLSMKNQIEDQFLPTYGAHSASTPWTSKNSLFAFWIGINDVGNSWWLKNSTLIDAIFAEYSSLLDQLYLTGARNYLFLTVPPVNLAPLTLQNGNYSIENEGLAIEDWNGRVKKMSEEFGARHNESTTFVHDTWSVFSKALKDPKAFSQTSEIKNTTSWCKAYENGTPTWYTLDESCKYPVNEWFWLNNLHPTFPINNATAASIVEYLNSATT
ncbi:hypothetical protein EJ04DRAFT_495218 [Polyplosphaeria fusca]|uniref:Carbohydrate esterase family 16 protein n=1 Tax=Polyplosphaeria fusca TaxID=682080 RepID=A0A9P4UYP5_9PLEO|nr:hypothetical protein EJ04DRAFT_495218 [Polyplosphaeria fusca]